MPKKIRFFCRTRTSSSFPASNAYMAKSHVMSTPIPLTNTLFVGYAPRLPGSLNVMKGINQLSLPASSPFSVALSLYLKLLNLSGLDTAMTTRLSNSCVPSFATTRSSAPAPRPCYPNSTGAGQRVSAPSSSGCSTYRPLARGFRT